ncbi:hypothetical protein Gbfr_006_111 [Gluconobacter frateurii M-2]|nr:hypothetical protein Gbfr_006_111 [Gluconobacter frateurii M-2]
MKSRAFAQSWKRLKVALRSKAELIIVEPQKDPPRHFDRAGFSLSGTFLYAPPNFTE